MMTEQEHSEIMTEQERSEWRSQRATRLVEAACVDGYDDDGEGSAHVDIIADLCHHWRSTGKSIAQLIHRVVFVLGDEILDQVELSAIESEVRDCVESLQAEATLDEEAAN